MGFAAGIGPALTAIGGGSALGSATGAAIGHTSIAAALQSLMSNPLWGSIFAQKGADFLEGILSPPTPYENVTGQALRAGASVIPELQAQARGDSTPATKAITRQARREGTRAGQSFAQGARRAGLVGGTPGGTAPYRAELSRIEAGTQEALVQRLGENQQRAIQALYGGLGGTIDQATAQEQFRDRGQSALLSGLGKWIREYKAKGTGDPRDDEMYELIREIIRG